MVTQNKIDLIKKQIQSISLYLKIKNSKNGKTLKTQNKNSCENNFISPLIFNLMNLVVILVYLDFSSFLLS